MPRAMVLGILAVALIYIAMNMTYVYAMPLSEVAKHETIAHAAAAALFSPQAALWLSAMIAISCFSAAATCTLSGARVYMAMAQDGAFFKSMAKAASEMANAGVQLDRPGSCGRLLTLSGRYDQLYTYVIFGMVLSYADGGGLVHSSAKAPRCRATGTMRGISMGTGLVRAGRRRVDAEHDHHSPRKR